MTGLPFEQPAHVSDGVNTESSFIGDSGVRGFLDCAPDPLRYSAATRVPGEATGMLCDRIPRGSRVLDIGCGTGSISMLIREECSAEVVGIEPDAARAEACARRGLNVRCGLWDHAAASELGKFDVVMFADVIEHVQDPVALLELAASALTPRGIVVVSTPNVAHWTLRLALLRGRFDYAPIGIMDATHLRWFTRKTLHRVLRAAGLEVVDHDWTNGAWMDCYSGGLTRVARGRLRTLVKIAPDLFGCQHIVVATRSTEAL